MKLERTLRVVVFPEPVPPETSMFSRERTQARTNCAMGSVMVPNLIRSVILYGSFENFRMVRMGPFRDRGGMMTLTREPSLRRASTIGDPPFMPRPHG